MKTGRREGFQAWHMIVLGIVSVMVISGLVSCSWFEDERRESPTNPAGSAFELGNYAQQTGQSRVVTVNGAQRQINGVVSGSVVAGGLYLEINEQSSVGSPAGTDQVMVSLQDVKLTFTELPSKISAITVRSDSAELGQYAVSDGSVEIALTYAQWTQWYGPMHYAVICEAVGDDELVESMAAVSGRLPSGEVVTFGKGFGSAPGGGTSCPACPACPPAGTVNPNDLPTFVDNGDGTVTDTRTGLIWLQDANCNGAQTWANAGTWAGNLASGSCGLTDGSTAGQWRLPTVTELQDLIDYSQSNPALPSGGAPFTNVQNFPYWTSTDYAPVPTAAWHVTLRNGYVATTDKSSTYGAWAVR
jgi:hypothetical protein